MSYQQRAEFYDIEYDEERDVAFVVSLVTGVTGRVLEVPCGVGRLSRKIAHRTGRLTLVDIEPDMVSGALQAVRDVCPDAKVTGIVQDMRHLSLEGMFDLVIIPREALQLFPPREGAAILATVAAVVAPGGRLFLDMAVFRRDVSIPPDPDYYRPAHVDGVLYPDWSRCVSGGRVSGGRVSGGRVSGGAIMTRRSVQWHDADSILFDLRYEIVRDDRMVESWMSSMRLYRYDRAWIDEMIPVGMTVEHVFGSYDRTPFSALSNRMISIYRKSNA